MACYCGACGVRLDGGWENYGSFPVSDQFEGWHQEPGKPAKLPDTCRDCYEVLVKATTDAANAIVREHKGSPRQVAFGASCTTRARIGLQAS